FQAITLNEMQHAGYKDSYGLNRIALCSLAFEVVNKSAAHSDRCVACSLAPRLSCDMSRRSLRGSWRSGLLATIYSQPL
ncbi:MAG: hypothetical protein ACHBMF_09805, partial [Chromatiales bacterium]